MKHSPRALPDARQIQEFWQLVQQQSDRALRLAYHLTGDAEAARDIVQDAFFRAWRSLGRFRGEQARLSTWFIRILINQAKSYRRWRWLQMRLQIHLSGQDPSLPPPDPPDADQERERLRGRIGRALDRLSAGQRAVFVLVYLEDLSLREAAQLLGLSPGTAKSHLHRALEKLRRELVSLREAQT